MAHATLLRGIQKVFVQCSTVSDTALPLHESEGARGHLRVLKKSFLS